MSEVKITSPRVRVFVDFWNFSLSLRSLEPGFKIDWQKVPQVFVREASNALGAVVPPTYEAMHVYGSYDPNKPKDAGFKNWYTNWLDAQPGVHAVMLERQKKRNHSKCPHCQEETKTCPSCDGDLRGTEEKGVDTRIVTDMISLAWSGSYDVAVLVSSDRDFVPVADFLQSKGVKVIHASFPQMGNQLSQKCWGNFSIEKVIEDIRLATR